jgi:hypothetical protein
MLPGCVCPRPCALYPTFLQMPTVFSATICRGRMMNEEAWKCVPANIRRTMILPMHSLPNAHGYQFAKKTYISIAPSVSCSRCFSLLGYTLFCSPHLAKSRSLLASVSSFAECICRRQVCMFVSAARRRTGLYLARKMPLKYQPSSAAICSRMRMTRSCSRLSMVLNAEACEVRAKHVHTTGAMMRIPESRKRPDIAKKSRESDRE